MLGDFRNALFEEMTTYIDCNQLQSNDSDKETHGCRQHSRYMLMFLGITGCDGTTTELNGLTGVFGKTDSEYQNNMTCRWRITVAAGKVHKRPQNNVALMLH